MKTLNLIILFFLPLFCSFAQYDVAHDKNITAIKISNDNQLLVSAGEDKMVRIWDMNSGQMKSALSHPYVVNKIYLSNNNRWLITTTGYSNHCLWDLQQNKIIKCLADDQVFGFTSDNKNFIITSYSENSGKKTGQVGLVKVETFERTLFEPTFDVDSVFTDISYLKATKELVISTGEKKIYILPISGKKYKTVKYPEMVHRFEVSPTGALLVKQNSFAFFELTTGKEQCKIERPIIDENQARFISDKLIALIDNQNLIVFNVDSCNYTKMGTLPDIAIKEISINAQKVVYADNKKLTLIHLDTTQVDSVKFSANDLIQKYVYRAYLKGLNHFRKNKYKAAIDNFNLAMQKNTNLKDIYYYRGEAYRSTGQYHQAINDFINDNKLNPYRSMYSMALTYAHLNNVDSVISCLTQLQNSAFRMRWKTIKDQQIFSNFNNQEKWKKFIADADKDEAGRLVTMAETKFKRKDIFGGMDLLNKAVALDPYNPEWYKTKGDIYYEQGEYDNAIKNYRLELKYDSTRLTSVYTKIAKTLYVNREHLKAIAIIKELIKVDSSQFHLNLDIANFELERGNRTVAVEYLDHYIEVMPEDAYAYYLRASVMHNRDKCKEDIQQAMKLCVEQGEKIPAEFLELDKSF